MAISSNLKKILVILGVVALLSLTTFKIAQADSNTSSATSTAADCTVFNDASAAAMKNQMNILDKFMTVAQKGMQKAVKNSCISALSNLDFNLSSLIPDFNLFGMLLEAAINKFTSYITSQICEAIYSVVGEWNGIMGEIKKEWNVNSAFEQWGNDVLMEIPGGSTGFGSGGAGSTSSGTYSIYSGSSPMEGSGSSTGTGTGTGSSSSSKTCVETLAGTVCTDGSTSSNSLGNIAGNSTSGSAVGAEAYRLQELCNKATAAYESSKLSSGYGAEGNPSLKASATSACQTVANYKKQYADILGANAGDTATTGSTVYGQSSTSDVIYGQSGSSSSAVTLPVR